MQKTGKADMMDFKGLFLSKTLVDIVRFLKNMMLFLKVSLFWKDGRMILQKS